MNINDIKLNPNNPRYIKDDRYQKLKKNMQEFPKMMKLRPIITDDEGVILGGNMRYLAMKDLGYTEIPEGWVVKASELTEEERKRFTITDNIPYGDWDYDILANEWDMTELQDWGIELPEIEINTEEDEFDVDKAIEEVKEPICKTGDIWQLGNHRLMCGDSTKKEDVERLMDGKKADMIFTDPPYGIDLDTDYTKLKTNLRFNKEKHIKGGRKYGKVIGDNKEYNPEHIFRDFEYCKEIFLWGANYYHFNLLKGGSWSVWDKRITENLDRGYGKGWELCWSKNKHSDKIIRITWFGVFGTEQEFDHKRTHPTQKPIQLAKYFIDKYIKENNIIVDLFGGSGSTLIACEQLNRICYGMEIDPVYCDVIINRWEKYTNKKAVKINE